MWFVLLLCLCGAFAGMLLLLRCRALAPVVGFAASRRHTQHTQQENYFERGDSIMSEHTHTTTPPALVSRCACKLALYLLAKNADIARLRCDHCGNARPSISRNFLCNPFTSSNANAVTPPRHS